MAQNTDLLVADIGGTNARFAISDGDGALDCNDGCPGDPAVFLDRPEVTGSAGAAAATAPRWCTTA